MNGSELVSVPVWLALTNTPNNDTRLVRFQVEEVEKLEPVFGKTSGKLVRKLVQCCGNC